MRGWIIGLVLTGWVGRVQAQDMRPFATFRQMHGETRLSARLEYAAGLLRVAAGPAAQLYGMDLSYDDARYQPVSDYDAESRTVTLGVTPEGEGGVRVVSRSQLRQVAAITFSPAVDLALAMTLGAVDADVDVGGLRITALSLKSGASRTVLRFSQPNPVRCRIADISAGAAEVSIVGLGNSRCEAIQFEGGMGKVLLDFTGKWSSDSRAQVKMAVGELTLRLPRSIGVRVRMDKVLSSFEPAGLVRRGDVFESLDYQRRTRHLVLDLRTAVGGVNLEWVDN
ncbi:MAG TPA: hypothetical protein VHH32_04755 [Gemmatimonadales bacterium]|nr:hypothetical protein [Gemmatimonadales bacterium]